MSIDESPTETDSRNCGPRRQAGEPADARPVHAATLLSWAQPPQIDTDACSALTRSFFESEIRYDARERQVHAVWIRHLMKLGFCTIEEVCEALASTQPFTALQCLEITAGGRLCEYLEGIIANHSLGGGSRFYPNVTVDLMEVSESEAPTLLIAIDQPYEFSVDSLHRIPVRLAALVYESFQLLRCTVLECMLPHELRRDEARYAMDDITDWVQAIQRAGGRRDIERAARFVQSEEAADYFSSDPQTLIRELDYFTDVLYLQPPWMRDLKTKYPIRRTRRLLRKLSQYEIESGGHPWLDYARYVCETILSRFADERALRACEKRLARHKDQEIESGVPLYYSLVLSSRSPIELEHIQTLADGLMNQGEHAVERFYLTEMATQQLREIVELRATGLGLLARAEAVNEKVLRPRFRRSYS